MCPGIQKWISVIYVVFDPNNKEHLDSLIHAAQSIPQLHEEFEWFLGPIKLNSPEAKRQKEHYDMIKSWEKRNKPSPPGPPPQEVIQIQLDSFEKGDMDAWWRLTYAMALTSNGPKDEHLLNRDLTVLPGWEESDNATKGRIVKAAQEYVSKAKPDRDKWLESNARNMRDLGDCKAIRLLFVLGKTMGKHLTSQVWKEWAPVVLAYHERDADFHKSIIEAAYQNAPEEIIYALNRIIDREDKQDGNIMIIRKMALCWDQRLLEAVLQKAMDKKLKPSSMADLLEHLLEQGMEEAHSFARSLVAIPLPKDEPGRSRALQASRALMLRTEDGGWEIVWPAIQSDTEFGKELLMEVSHNPRRVFAEDVFPKKLTEEQIADLCIWLENQFPTRDDPEPDHPSRRYSVGQLRNSALLHLQSRGTSNALSEIDRIIQALPDCDFLKRVRLEAHAVMLRHKWIPPQPSELLKMLADSERRFAESGDQLLKAIVESLNRLQRKLRESKPILRRYWDRVPDKKDLYRPLYENEFSNNIKDHLEQDLVNRGIVVNREVEVCLVKGKGRGLSTDIQVDAVAPNPRKGQLGRVTVFIESKGCWNKELYEAMETQLRDKYLKAGSCNHGIYLIGWFNCDKWDKNDKRKQRAAKLTIEQARETLKNQATELSEDGIVIKVVVLDMSLQ